MQAAVEMPEGTRIHWTCDQPVITDQKLTDQLTVGDVRDQFVVMTSYAVLSTAGSEFGRRFGWSARREAEERWIALA